MGKHPTREAVQLTSDVSSAMIDAYRQACGPYITSDMETDELWKANMGAFVMVLSELICVHTTDKSQIKPVVETLCRQIIEVATDRFDGIQGSLKALAKIMEATENN